MNFFGHCEKFPDHVEQVFHRTAKFFGNQLILVINKRDVEKRSGLITDVITLLRGEREFFHICLGDSRKDPKH